MKFLLYFLLVPIIFSFLQSNTIFERKNIAGKKHQEGHKQIIKHKKILYSNSELLLQGQYTRPANLPLIKEGIRVTECLFSKCYNYNLNGGAIMVNIASKSYENPKIRIESSTFHECCTFLHDSKGGALFIQGFTFLSTNNCFSTCSSIFGVFCYYEIQDTFDCDINQTTFHTNAKPGIGRGSVVVCSEYMKMIDNNLTNLIVGDDGSGLISTVSYEYYICRNIFQSCKGKSTIFIDIIPIHSIFQLLNFIDNVEKGNGIISIPNNYMFSKCFFHNCGPVLINSQKGKTFIYQCVFDSALKSSKSIFIGSVKNKDPFWNGDDGQIRFGINAGANSQYCQPNSGGDVDQIFTPTKTPYFYGFSPNPADIVILVCIGILFICLVFTLVYFLWYCICSKPNLKSSIEYLKTKEVDQYKDVPLLSSNDYSESIFDMEESRDKKKKKKKSKKKKNLFDSEEEEIDNVVDEEDIKKSKKKKSKKKKNLFDSDDEEIGDLADEENVDTKSIKITDLSEDEDESKNKSDFVDKKKAKSKKKEKSKSKKEKSKSKKEKSKFKKEKSKSKKEKSKSKKGKSKSKKEKSKSKETQKPDSENKEKNTIPSEDELSISVPESDKNLATIINSSSDLGIPKEMLSSEPYEKPEPELKTKPEPELEPEPEPDIDLEPEPKTGKNHKSKSKHKSHSKKKTKTEHDTIPEEDQLNLDSYLFFE